MVWTEFFFSGLFIMQMMQMGAWGIQSSTKPSHHPNSAFCTKNNRFCPRIHQTTEQLRLISLKISCHAEAKPWGKALMTCQCVPKTMILQLMNKLNSFKTHPQSAGLNHSKQSIGNVKIRPIPSEYLFLLQKTKMAILKSG